MHNCATQYNRTAMIIFHLILQTATTAQALSTEGEHVTFHLNTTRNDQCIC